MRQTHSILMRSSRCLARVERLKKLQRLWWISMWNYSQNERLIYSEIYFLAYLAARRRRLHILWREKPKDLACSTQFQYPIMNNHVCYENWKR